MTLPVVCWWLTAFLLGAVFAGVFGTETNPDGVKGCAASIIFVAMVAWIVLWVLWGVRLLHL